MIRVPSVQRVRPRGGSEFVSVFVQYEDDETKAGAWRVLEDLHELNAKLKATGCGPVQVPPLKRMLVDAKARAGLAKELVRVWHHAAKDDKVRRLLGEFLQVRDLPVQATAGAAPMTSRASVAKLRTFYIMRAQARVLNKVAAALRGVRQVLGAATGGLVLAALAATWARRKELRSALVGALAGLGAASLAYESSLHKESASAQSAASLAAEAVGKSAALSDDDGADFEVLRKAMDAEMEAKYAPQEDEDASAEALEAARAAEQALVDELDALDANHEHIQAWKRVQAYLDKPAREQGIEVLWRAARAGYYTASIMKGEVGETDPARLATLRRALDIVEDLLERFPDAAETHKYYAIIAQDWTNHQGTKEKIIGGFTFEKHTLRAIELDPDDPTLQYMYGMFCFEVAKLSWAERVGAKAVFGREPPKTTFDQALQHFKKAHALRKPDLAALFEMARCYEKLKRKADAREVIRELYSYPRDESNPEWAAVMDAAREFEAGL